MTKKYFSLSLMCADVLNIGTQLDILGQNNFDFFHIDIMDLNFVPNLALSFDIVKALDKYSVPKDIHLMVKDVSLALKNLSIRKNDYVSFHIEIDEAIEENIDFIRNSGARPGLVINPSTPLEKILPYLSRINLIHLMTVEPGFVGQSFIGNSYDRAKFLSSKISERKCSVLLGVDGGIGFEQIKKLSTCGVDLFVLGTTCVFKKDNFESQVKLFLEFKRNLENRRKKEDLCYI